MADPSSRRVALLRTALARFGSGLLILALVFFLTAGTMRYWQAWMVLATLFIPMIILLVYLLASAPDLLERRLRGREKEVEQRKILRLSLVFLFLSLFLPGLDIRFGWSSVPWQVAVLADVLVLLGYGIFARVLLENRFASRTVQVDEGQTVITTGPYTHVRHPMYTGVILMYLMIPLALGSYWAVIPALGMIPAIVARINNEEEVMVRELRGYAEYRITVRYRLIPGVW